MKRSMNNYAKRSKTRNSVEEELRVEIEERSTAQEELNEEIEKRAAIEKALEESKIQAELYLDLMGHDINNLNQVGIGYLELAKESTDLDEIKSLIDKPLEVMKSASQIIDNVRKLKQITIENPNKDYAVKVVNLCDILPELQERYSHVNGRDITINLQSPKLCFVKANELISDVFSNLLDNSVKHSDPIKPLIINVKMDRVTDKNKNYYLCTVEDNGPGIPRLGKG